jgi:hypothetical protein
LKSGEFFRKLIGQFTPGISEKSEIKFGGNIQALTFATPMKSGAAKKADKIFESLEATVHKN